MRCCTVTKNFIVIVVLLSCSTACVADDRTQLPSFLQNSYFGVTGGLAHFAYTDASLEPNFHSTGISRDVFAVRLYFGHYFNPYLAAQIGFMGAIKRPQYHGVTAPHSANPVRTTFLNFTLKPTLPINDWFALYGEGGVTTVSREGFTTSTKTTALPDAFLVSPLTGLGAIVRLNQNWHIDMGTTYIWAHDSYHQPSALYALAGLYYLFTPAHHASQAVTPSRYYFPAHMVEFGFCDQNVFYWNPSHFLPSPLFYGGSIKVARGAYLMYEQNFYHTERWFSFDWGVSVGRWISHKNHEEFYTFSIFPALRLWLVHSASADLYFAYSVAGPAVLTRRVIDERDAGSYFTFQDYLGIGMFLGKSKCLNLSLKLLHYSNGNVLPKNPGISAPVSFNIGYTW